MKSNSQFEINTWTGTLKAGQANDASLVYRRLTILFLLLLLTGTIVGIIVPAGPGWDFANFYDTGRRIVAGQIGDLYKPDTLIAGGRPQGKLGFYGAPISALLYAPLSYFSATWAMVLFKIQNTLAYFAALILLYLHNRNFAGPSPKEQWRFAALFAGLSLIYQPFWTVYRVGGQTTPTVFLLLTLALIFHVRSRFLPSALCMVAAVLIKPAFIVALALLVCFSGWRFFRHTVAIFALWGLVSISLLGWGVHEEFLRVMAQGSQESRPWFYNSSIYVIAENMKLLGGAAPPSLLLGVSTVAVKLATLAVCVYALAKCHELKLPVAARRHFDFLIAVVFCLLVSQIVWEHYLAALFPLLAYIAAARRHFSREAVALAGAIFLMAAWQNLILVDFLRAHFNLDTMPELALIGLLKSAPLLLTLVFLFRNYKEMFRSYAAPAWSH